MVSPVEVLAQLLSPAQAEVLDEIGTNTWGSISRVLNVIMDRPPEITGTEARLVMPDEIMGEFGERHLVAPIALSTARDQSATAYVVFPTAGIAGFLDVSAADPVDEEQQAIVVGSTILGQALQMVNAQVFGSSPIGLVLELESVTANSMPALLAEQDEPALALTITLAVLEEVRITVLLPGTFLDIMAGALPVADRAVEEVAAPANNPFALTLEEIESAEIVDVPQARAMREPAMATTGGPAFGGGQQWREEFPSQPAGGPPSGGLPPREPVPISNAPTAQRARFAPLPDPEPAMSRGSIDLLSMLQMNVSVELGRTQLTVAEVLALGPGSVIELDRLAGEPVDILVNERLVARGEVVVVDENFGIRVVEVIRRSADEERAG